MILAVGLSPAWQHTLAFEALERGAVNRALASAWCASGKVINVALALSHVRAEAKTVCLIGGDTGRSIRAEFAAAGIAARWIESHSPTRVCTTLLETAGGPTTELVENVGPVRAGELAEFREAVRAEAAAAEYLVFSGSLPAGAPTTFFAELLADTHRPALLDFRGPELLACLPHRPLLVKPNRHELAHTVGQPVASEADVQRAAGLLIERGAQAVLVSHGAEPALLVSTAGTYRLRPPAIRPANPIGSGDSLAAVTTWALSTGRPLVEAVRLGMAAAVENALEFLPARFDASRLEPRSREIVIEQLDD